MDQITFCGRCGSDSRLGTPYCARCGSALPLGVAQPRPAPPPPPSVFVAPEILEDVPSARRIRRRRISQRYGARDGGGGMGATLGMIVVGFLVLTVLSVLAISTGNILIWWVIGGLGGIAFFFWALYLVIGSATRR